MPVFPGHTCDHSALAQVYGAFLAPWRADAGVQPLSVILIPQNCTFKLNLRQQPPSIDRDPRSPRRHAALGAPRTEERWGGALPGPEACSDDEENGARDRPDIRGRPAEREAGGCMRGFEAIEDRGCAWGLIGVVAARRPAAAARFPVVSSRRAHAHEQARSARASRIAAASDEGGNTCRRRFSIAPTHNVCFFYQTAVAWLKTSIFWKRLVCANGFLYTLPSGFPREDVQF